jgi:hypothetical protein
MLLVPVREGDEGAERGAGAAREEGGDARKLELDALRRGALEGVLRMLGGGV